MDGIEIVIVIDVTVLFVPMMKAVKKPAAPTTSWSVYARSSRFVVMWRGERADLWAEGGRFLPEMV